MQQNGRFRKNENRFTVIPNHILEDETVSFKAKGLYCVIARYLAKENWTLYKSFLQHKSKEGDTAFESTWKELKKSGYLKVYRMRDTEHNVFYWEYELLEVPEPVQESENSHTHKTDPMGKDTVQKGGNIQNTRNTEDLTSNNPPTPTGEEREEKAEQISFDIVPEAVQASDKGFYKKLLRVARRANKGITDQEAAETMAKVTKQFEKLSNIKSPYKYFAKMLENEILHPTTEGQTTYTVNQEHKPGANFHNFTQRKTDYDALLKELNRRKAAYMGA